MYTKHQIEVIADEFKQKIEQGMTKQEVMLMLIAWYKSNKLSEDDVAFIVWQVYGEDGKEFLQSTHGVTNAMLEEIFSKKI
jgi:hypothetical protein